MEGKKTLVLGASLNPDRASHEAVLRLLAAGHEVVAVGIHQGAIQGVPILQGQPDLENVHTVTLYLNPQRQKPYYDYILNLAPKRIVFNPGTENRELMELAKERGIFPEVGCNLVMLSLGTY
jgi:hypothetical protein